jgi:peptide/nickel transport system ATP-binding protein
MSPTEPTRAGALEIEDLTVKYGRDVVVSDVSLTLTAGTTLGLVGESGSGKTTVAAAAVGLVSPASGAIRVDGVDVLSRNAAAARARRRMQLVFQDPFSALDPRMAVGDSIAEATRATGRRWSRDEKVARVRQLLDRVRIDPDRAHELPAAFSGGQRQRITIARALAGEPSVLIADEVTSALDVSVQGTILNLLRELQEQLGLSMLFISHNLAVVRYVSDRICVMRDGRIVEQGPTDQVVLDPADPYTRALLDAVPVLGRRLEFPDEAP